MQTDNNENKVVSIFDRPRTTDEKSKADKDEDFDFETIIKKNADNKYRQNRDRAKSNRGVIRSYRLKH